MITRLPQLVNCTDTLNFRGVITYQHRRNLVLDATHLRTTLGRNSAYSCNIVYADMKTRSSRRGSKSFCDLRLMRIFEFSTLQTGHFARRRLDPAAPCSHPAIDRMRLVEFELSTTLRVLSS
ncbi:hypothetical protein COCMIDRAFT_36491 [Bipolaris oryzae ATCC 44560]|uniref:Uncharacterized protein n=1 Tax=Bipolaris oryzae ATCC 44560 TaxID=930090 RepID=W6Z7P8_COCMI|nr:uncharacterized protein COCMIDRAFT_36491 [Bipolaris oryzae ATCC 44560]EUC45788.1 hypothetical protein COCMIDRAFT_36491 [Bipolaris oryzae ATCC 44560]